MSAGKYIVFKKSEWDSTTPFDNLKPIEDCVVIRYQDVFAAPALYTYANSIVVTIEILRQMHKGLETPQMVKLQELADYFFEASQKAEQYDYKKFAD